MREQVCLVLNEREKEKAKLASDLEARLKKHNITVSRPAAETNLLEILNTKNPSVLVLDYLLGDYTTGLDILTTLRQKDKVYPKIIFLTDEPSVGVAVSALTSGADGYYEFADPAVLDDVEDRIKEELDQLPAKETILPTKAEDLGSLLAHSKTFQNTIATTQALITRKAPLMLVVGANGSGISTFVNSMVANQQSSCFVKTIDLRTFDGSFEELCGLGRSVPGKLQLGNNLSLVIEHVEEDTGELLEFLARHHNAIWPKNIENKNYSFLTACSTSEELYKTWGKLLPIEKIQIPPLSARRDDIPPLAQLFLAEVLPQSGKNKSVLTSKTLLWLKELEWPGNVKQLRAVIANAALHPDFNDNSQKEIIEEGIVMWEESHKYEVPKIDRLTAAMVLEISRHNYRIAAAKLGCSPLALRNILSQV